MGIVNKRNALLGWAVWTFGPRVAKRKAKNMVGSGKRSGKKKKALFAALAALGGAMIFWRKRRASSKRAE